MLQRRNCVLDGALRPCVVAVAEVNDHVAQRDVLGSLEGALHLVHGVDAAGFLRVEHVHCGRSGSAHLPVGIERSVHGKRLECIRSEPGSQLGDVLAAGVIKMLTRGKNFDCLSAGQFCMFE